VYAGATPVNDSLTYGTGWETNFNYSNLAALYLWNDLTVNSNPPGAIRRFRPAGRSISPRAIGSAWERLFPISGT